MSVSLANSFSLSPKLYKCLKATIRKGHKFDCNSSEFGDRICCKFLTKKSRSLSSKKNNRRAKILINEVPDLNFKEDFGSDHDVKEQELISNEIDSGPNLKRFQG